jgi:hypothetical protein
MIMMNKRKFNHRTKVKLFTLIPVSVISLVIVACVNGFFPPVLHAENNHNKVSGSVDKSRLYNGDTMLHGDTIKVIGYGQAKGSDKSARQKVYIVHVDPKDTTKVTYILDGAEIHDISGVNPDSIRSVDVYKSKGLVVIRSKGNGTGADNRIEIVHRRTKDVDSTKVDVVYMVNNLKVSKEDIEKISPEDIERVEVFNDKEMVKKLASGNTNSIIIVTTKKKTK